MMKALIGQIYPSTLIVRLVFLHAETKRAKGQGINDTRRCR
jgi:hypothetical protein